MGRRRRHRHVAEAVRARAVRALARRATRVRGGATEADRPEYAAPMTGAAPLQLWTPSSSDRKGASAERHACQAAHPSACSCLGSTHVHALVAACPEVADCEQSGAAGAEHTRPAGALLTQPQCAAAATQRHPSRRVSRAARTLVFPPGEAARRTWKGPKSSVVATAKCSGCSSCASGTNTALGCIAP